MSILDGIGTQLSRFGNFLGASGIGGSLPYIGGALNRNSTKNWGNHGEQYDMWGTQIDPSIYPQYNADGTSKTGGPTLTQDQMNGHAPTGATPMANPNHPAARYALKPAYPGATYGQGSDGKDAPVYNVAPAYPGATYGQGADGLDAPVTKGLAAGITPPPPVVGPSGTNAPALMNAASNTYQAQSQRYDDQYAAIQNRQNALTPDMIAQGQRNAFDQPFLQANGTDRAALNGQNGGGHMGGYGYQTQAAINAGASIAAQNGISQYNTQAANEQNAFTQQKGTDLANLNAGYGNVAQGWAGLGNSANAQTNFNTQQTNLVNSNYGQGLMGLASAAGTLFSNPTAQQGLGNIANGIGASASGAWNAATSGSSPSGTTPQPSNGGVSYPSGNNGLPPATGGSPTDNSGLPGPTSGSPEQRRLLSLDDPTQPQGRGLTRGAPAQYRGA